MVRATMAQEKLPVEMEMKHLDVKRLGDDAYTATELVLRSSDGGKKWIRVAERQLFPRETRLVAEAFVRDWWREYVGPDFTAGSMS